MTTVAIIGAGLSALSAARWLAQTGCNVALFEKSRGPGGRLSTRRESWGQFDQGAQYFTARDHRFLTQLEHWRERGVVAPWAFEPMVWKQGELSASPDRQQRWVGIPGMSALSRDLASGLHIHSQLRIVALRQQRQQWWLHDHHGQQHGPYDGVLISAPAAQTADLLPDDCPLRRDVSRISMQPCWSVTLAYAQALAQPWVQGVFCQHPVVRWVAGNNSKPGRPPAPHTWVLHLQPAWSRQHLQRPPAEIAQLARQILGEILNCTPPREQHHYVHRWRYAQPVNDDRLAQLVDASGKLGVCGDWTEGGRVEGAYLSGLRAAASLLSAL
ncbi:MAG: NAD(P)/FAD-dependent oxidoreductase [Wenzhouxiangellaceae bacterium]